MKSVITLTILALGLMVCAVRVSNAAPMGTTWTYQGRLIEGDEAVDGLYDFQFKLFSDPCTGKQLGSMIDINDLDVIDGYFTAELDFGSYAFNGYARWLEISVRPGNSTERPIILEPRHEVTLTPYAIYAQKAGDANTVDGFNANDFASMTHSHSASDITSGILNTERYSAFSDLTREGYLDNAADDIAQNNGILQPKLNADSLDGFDSSDFLTTANDFGRNGVSSTLYEGTTPLVSKYLGISAQAADSDRLDGLHAFDFASSSHYHNNLYYTESESDSRFVNVNGDTMTGSLSVSSYSGDFAVKGIGDNVPTNGYLGIQGIDGYDSVASTYWSDWEIGVAGISTGSSADDNYGVVGHASQAGVRGEYSGDPNNYGELGRSDYGVYANATRYGVYANASGTGTITGAYNRSYHVGTSGHSYGTYSTAHGSDTGNTYGILTNSQKSSSDTSGISYGGYMTGENDSAGDSYGIYARAIGSSGTNYGVYGYAGEGTNNYAGYFNGDKSYFSGDVGIGTETPIYKLEVNGSMGISADASGKLRVGRHSATSPYSYISAVSGADQMRLQIGDATKMVITGDGNVGIGTTSPAGTLDVNGSIYQRGSVLHADYVFEPGYELESIDEHSEFMWNEKHLPAIPKAELDENGREILEVGAHRRGIVEELEKAHIYIEQLHKKNNELETRLVKLEALVARLNVSLEGGIK